MNPVQTEAVAATAPCREEKKVPTRPGSAEPVKIPVKFYQENIVRTLICPVIKVGCRETHVDETQINFDAMKHTSERSHENCEASNGIMPYAKNLGVSSFGVDV
jgi:hypothetical protein